MRFYRHWARAEAPVERDAGAWRIARYAGSDEGVDAAQREAARLAHETAAIFSRGDLPDGYLYSDRPVREEIVDEVHEGGERIAVITRNAYGSLVLNTESVMFIDIDDAKPGRTRTRRTGQASKPGLLGRLLGRKMDHGIEVAQAPADPIEQHVRQFVDEMPGMGLRLYRTAAGYRCLITSGLYDPTSADAKAIMKRLGSDPLYVKLCQVQECFRARLSAKFWRCGADRPPVRFPWANAEQELRMREWEQAYHAAADSCATCELVDELGAATMAPQAAKIAALHDEMCLRPGAKLA